MNINIVKCLDEEKNKNEKLHYTMDLFCMNNNCGSSA